MEEPLYRAPRIAVVPLLLFCSNHSAQPGAGAEGVLERHKNGLRVVLRLEMLARSISLEVGATEIESVSRKWLAPTSVRVP